VQLNLAESSQQLRRVSPLSSVYSLRLVAVLLCCGGSFSVGVFEAGRCIFHKSDHKYVVRKKAGQRQLTKDGSSSGSIQSLGSQLRRDQEKKHQANVYRAISESFSLLSKCDLIFLQAPGVNSNILFAQEQGLRALRGRIRRICLSAKKAKYEEVERIYKSLMRVYIFLRKP